MMTFGKLVEMMHAGTLKTRGFGKVVKLRCCHPVDGSASELAEVWVENIPWCIGTVWVETGRLCIGEENDEDLVY